MNTTDSRWIALVVLCTGMLMIILDSAIVNVALPPIQSDLGFSQSNLTWVVNAYLIPFGGLLLLAGRRLARPGRPPPRAISADRRGPAEPRPPRRQPRRGRTRAAAVGRTSSSRRCRARAPGRRLAGSSRGRRLGWRRAGGRRSRSPPRRAGAGGRAAQPARRRRDRLHDVPGAGGAGVLWISGDTVFYDGVASSAGASRSTRAAPGRCALHGHGPVRYWMTATRPWSVRAWSARAPRCRCATRAEALQAGPRRVEQDVAGGAHEFQTCVRWLTIGEPAASDMNLEPSASSRWLPAPARASVSARARARDEGAHVVAGARTTGASRGSSESLPIAVNLARRMGRRCWSRRRWRSTAAWRCVTRAPACSATFFLGGDVDLQRVQGYSTRCEHRTGVPMPVRAVPIGILASAGRLLGAAQGQRLRRREGRRELTKRSPRSSGRVGYG